MSTPRRWSRRRFLQTAMGSSAALVTVGLSSSAWLQPVDGLPPSSRLVSAIRDRESAMVIGREYLSMAPGDADTNVLSSLIAARIQGHGEGPGRMSDAALRTQLEATIREDFARGDMVRVRGWLLSATEVRLCALVALADPAIGT